MKTTSGQNRRGRGHGRRHEAKRRRPARGAGMRLSGGGQREARAEPAWA